MPVLLQPRQCILELVVLGGTRGVFGDAALASVVELVCGPIVSLVITDGMM